MHSKPKQCFPLRSLSSVLLTLALGGCGLAEEPQPSESHATKVQDLALPPGLTPSLVKDIQVGNVPSHPMPGSFLWGSTPVSTGSKVYFRAWSDSLGDELWRTDGTEEGTQLVRDLIPGVHGSNIQEMATVGESVFVSLFNYRDNTRPLWKTDGAVEGSFQVMSATGSVQNAQTLIGCNGQLFFTRLDSFGGSQLWKTDGTPEGTVLVRDVMPGPLGSSASATWLPSGPFFVPVGPHGAVAFAASNGLQGMELWMTDGTTEGTRMLSDVAPGAMSASPLQLTVSGSRLFFVADEGVHGRELWSVKQAAFQSR